jgi:hypothetical protein
MILVDVLLQTPATVEGPLFKGPNCGTELEAVAQNEMRDE